MEQGPVEFKKKYMELLEKSKRMEEEYKLLEENLRKYVENVEEIAKKKMLELESTKNFLEALLNLANSFIIVIDEQQRILLFNKRCEEELGYKEKEVLGRFWYELILPPELRDETKRFFEALLPGQKGYFHSKFQTRYGDVLFVRLSYSAIPKSKDGEKRVIILAYDISKEFVREKEREELLQNISSAKRLWEATFNFIEDMLIVINRDFVVEKANRGAAVLVGKDVREILGKKCYNLLGFELPCNGCPVQETILKNIPSFGELRWGNRFFKVSSYPFFEGKEAKRVVVSHSEITSLKIKEAELKTTNSILYSLINSLDTGIVVFDETQKVSIFNERFCEFFSLDPESILGKSRDELISKIESTFKFKGGTDRLKEISLTKKIFVEVETLKPKRSVFLKCSVPVYMEGKRFIGVLESFTDITDVKLMEKKIAQAEKFASLGEMVSGILHEINNPLTSISGFSKMLLEEELSESAKEFVNYIHKETERLRKIVERLLAFSRESTPIKKMVNINDLVEDSLILLAKKLQEESIEVEKKLDKNIPLILADPIQIEQVFLNILDNSIYALRDKKEKRITVETKMEDGHLMIKLSDNGEGISEEHMDLLFDPFFTTKPFGKGTGLGLSISYRIIKNHGGEIKVESEKDRGTSVIIYLPLETPKESKLEGVERDYSGKSVLIFSSDLYVLNLLQKFLKKKGFLVKVGESEKEFLGNFDLFIVDLEGKELESLDALYEKKVVFLGNKPSKFGPFAHFLKKPFTLDELVKILGSLF